jgi:hypothetical protein
MTDKPRQIPLPQAHFLPLVGVAAGRGRCSSRSPAPVPSFRNVPASIGGVEVRAFNRWFARLKATGGRGIA